MADNFRRVESKQAFAAEFHSLTVPRSSVATNASSVKAAIAARRAALSLGRMPAAITGDCISVIARAQSRCRAVWYRQDLFPHARAPSSVVEHVTFNHGVPGSIPGGPILRS